MKKVILPILILVCILLVFNLSTLMEADESTQFYTYYERETRILNDQEYIETSVHGYSNFTLLKESIGAYGLPQLIFSDVDAGKLLGVWVNKERLDNKYYSVSFENKTYTFEFNLKDEKKMIELTEKFEKLNNFEIVISIYIKSKQQFDKKNGGNTFSGSYQSDYEKNDVYHKYSLVLPYPSEHNLRTTAVMEINTGKETEKWEPPIDVEIKNGDLILSWLITFPDKQQQFEEITGRDKYFVCVIQEEENGKKKLTFTINVEYSYETLPLLQLLCVAIASFLIGFTGQFFKDVEEGEYDKLEEIKKRRNRIGEKVRFFGIKNLKLKLKYSFLSFVILGAIILLQFAPDIFNTEAIRIFHVKLSSRLFSIETAKFIQGISIWILAIYLAVGFVSSGNFDKRERFKDEMNGVFRTIVSIFNAKSYAVAAEVIIALLVTANGLFQLTYSSQLFFVEMAFEVCIMLGFIAYISLIFKSIHKK
jgi:hypothetical protein